MTSAAAETAPRLTDEQLDEVLNLVKGADSVELKLTVPESDHLATVRALGMDSLNAQIRQVYFFDTPDLQLDRHGVVVRARRIQNKGDDTVVKLRPVVPDDLSPKLRKSPSFNVEVDAMPGGFVCSGSFKGVAQENIRRTVIEKLPIRKLFSKEQREFYSEHAPAGIALDDLATLGPLFVLKLKFVPPGQRRSLVSEMWFYPDFSRILELSTKCLPSETFQVVAELRAFLSGHAVDLTGDQATKTRKALEYFAAQLAAEGG